MLQVSCSCIVLNSACSSGLHSESARGSAHTSLCPFSINKTPSDYDILLPPQGSLPRLEHIPTYPAPTHHPFIQQPQLSQPVSLSQCQSRMIFIKFGVICYRQIIINTQIRVTLISFCSDQILQLVYLAQHETGHVVLICRNLLPQTSNICSMYMG